jgi:hypothetical protein
MSVPVGDYVIVRGNPNEAGDVWAKYDDQQRVVDELHAYVPQWKPDMELPGALLVCQTLGPVVSMHQRYLVVLIQRVGRSPKPLLNQIVVHVTHHTYVINSILIKDAKEFKRLDERYPYTPRLLWNVAQIARRWVGRRYSAQGIADINPRMLKAYPVVQQQMTQPDEEVFEHVGSAFQTYIKPSLRLHSRPRNFKPFKLAGYALDIRSNQLSDWWQIDDTLAITVNAPGWEPGLPIPAIVEVTQMLGSVLELKFRKVRFEVDRVESDRSGFTRLFRIALQSERYQFPAKPGDIDPATGRKIVQPAPSVDVAEMHRKYPFSVDDMRKMAGYWLALRNPAGVFYAGI